MSGDQNLNGLTVGMRRKNMQKWVIFFITRLKIPELNPLRDGSAERKDAVSTLSQSWLHL